MTKEESKTVGSKLESLVRRALENMGSALDKKLGSKEEGLNRKVSGDVLERMKRQMDEMVVDRGSEGRIAPHLLRLKIEWGKYSATPSEVLTGLEHQILVAAIDHINDNRYRTFAAVTVETTEDIFAKGVTVEPAFGEFEKLLQTSEAAELPRIRFNVEIISGQSRSTTDLELEPGGRRLSLGRSSDNDLCLSYPNVSKVHAVLVMNRESKLLIADTGSTNGTFVNDKRLATGEAFQIDEGDNIRIGDVELKIKKVN
jgi:hypothetical protein